MCPNQVVVVLYIRQFSCLSAGETLQTRRTKPTLLEQWIQYKLSVSMSSDLLDGAKRSVTQVISSFPRHVGNCARKLFKCVSMVSLIARTLARCAAVMTRRRRAYCRTRYKRVTKVITQVIQHAFRLLLLYSLAVAARSTTSTVNLCGKAREENVACRMSVRSQIASGHGVLIFALAFGVRTARSSRIKSRLGLPSPRRF